MISVYLNGRLGNQIFQYVMTRILSEKLHLNFWIPKNKEESIEFYSNIFLSEKRTEFNKIEETNEFPLIQQIFYLPFIKKVTLNKPFRTSGGPKKFSV